MDTITFEPSERDGKLISKQFGKITFPSRGQNVKPYVPYELINLDERDRVNIATVGEQTPVYVAVFRGNVKAQMGTRQCVYLAKGEEGKEDGVYLVNDLVPGKYRQDAIAYLGVKIQPTETVSAFIYAYGRCGDLTYEPSVYKDHIYKIINADNQTQYKIAEERYVDLYPVGSWAMGHEPTGKDYVTWAREEERKLYHGRTLEDIREIFLSFNRQNYIPISNDPVFGYSNRQFGDINIGPLRLREAETEDDLLKAYERYVAAVIDHINTPDNINDDWFQE